MLRSVVCLILLLQHGIQCAKILGVFPTPSISHQVVFRHITHELVRRGHEVVVITTDPEFKDEPSPVNFTEIDVHDISYEIWKKAFSKTATGKMEDLKNQIHAAFSSLLDIFVEQIKLPEVQKVLHDDSFDLLLLEAWIRTPLFFTHFHKVPVVQISSFHGYLFNHEAIGSVVHPMLYPLPMKHRFYNLSLWEKITQTYTFYSIYYDLWSLGNNETEVLRKFAPEMPELSELNKNVDMLFLNVYPIWDSNRPVPPNVVYIGGIHQMKQKKLTTDLETYLNSSKNGVIYVSFGTNTNTSTLPMDKIQVMVNVFSKLPYDILWKWDLDELPGRSKNIMISKWLPQSDLLKHPNIKLFITQGGLQSTDEGLAAGVPLIGIPILGDQFYNTEKYVYLNIGLRLIFETLTEEQFEKTIEEVIGNPRKNVLALRELVYDQPDTPLDRAMFWIEHLLRYGGGQHLRPPGAGLPWTEYLELELVFVLLSITSVLIGTVLCLVAIMRKKVMGLLVSIKKERMEKPKM